MLPTLQGFACSCGFLNLSEKYIPSSFVARVKIIKNHPNEVEEEIYRSDIEVLELFKGNFTTSLLIEGSNDGKRRGFCDPLLKENSEVLVYARKNRKGIYQLYDCSGSLANQKYEEKTFERELAALRVLKEQNITYTHQSMYGAHFYKLLEKHNGISLNKSFAIFEITFIEKEQVEAVRCVSGFSESFDKQFMESLKKARWVSGYDPDGVVLKGRSYPNNTTFVVLYYYGTEKEYPSFISENNL